MNQEGWGDKFRSRLEEQKQAKQEERKSFDIYRDHVMRLFDTIEGKVKNVAAIQVSKPIVGRTEFYGKDVRGLETVKSLCLKCGDKTIEFLPDGINTPYGKGRIRLRHSSKKLGQFVYLYLVKDPKSASPYPENLTWVIQDQKDGQEPTRCPVFDDRRIEDVIEACFLDA